MTKWENNSERLPVELSLLVFTTSFYFFYLNIPEVKHQHCVSVIEEHHNLGLPSVIWLVVGKVVEVGGLVDKGLLVLEVLVTTGVAEEAVVVWMALWDDG